MGALAVGSLWLLFQQHGGVMEWGRDEEQRLDLWEVEGVWQVQDRDQQIGLS